MIKHFVYYRLDPTTLRHSLFPNESLDKLQVFPRTRLYTQLARSHHMLVLQRLVFEDDVVLE